MLKMTKKLEEYNGDIGIDTALDILLADNLLHDEYMSLEKLYNEQESVNDTFNEHIKSIIDSIEEKKKTRESAVYASILFDSLVKTNQESVTVFQEKDTIIRNMLNSVGNINNTNQSKGKKSSSRVSRFINGIIYPFKILLSFPFYVITFIIDTASSIAIYSWDTVSAIVIYSSDYIFSKGQFSATANKIDNEIFPKDLQTISAKDIFDDENFIFDEDNQEIDLTNPSNGLSNLPDSLPSTEDNMAMAEDYMDTYDNDLMDELPMPSLTKK